MSVTETVVTLACSESSRQRDGASPSHADHATADGKEESALVDPLVAEFDQELRQTHGTLDVVQFLVRGTRSLPPQLHAELRQRVLANWLAYETNALLANLTV